MKTYTLLRQLTRLLVLQNNEIRGPHSFNNNTHLRVTKQFHHTTLIRRESRDFTDNRAHELGLRARETLAMTGLGRLRDRSGGAASVQAVAEVCKARTITISVYHSP